MLIIGAGYVEGEYDGKKTSKFELTVVERNDLTIGVSGEKLVIYDNNVVPFGDIMQAAAEGKGINLRLIERRFVTISRNAKGKLTGLTFGHRDEEAVTWGTWDPPAPVIDDAVMSAYIAGLSDEEREKLFNKIAA